MEPVRTTRPPRRDALETQRRLLAAGAKVFARDGFRRASIREICREARANLAAVRYHFQNKQGLYLEVLVRGHTELFRRQPMPVMEPGDDPAEALRNWLRWCLHAILSGRTQQPHLGKLMAQEMAEPTPAFDDIFRVVGEPFVGELERLIRRVLAESATPALVTVLTHTVLGICLHYDRPREVFRHMPSPPFAWSADIERLADQIYRFVIAGIRASVAESGAG